MSSRDSWRVLYERLNGSAAAGAEPASEPVASTAARPGDGDAERRICDVIVAWRAADRELARLTEADPDWGRTYALLVDLRALHHRLFEARAGRRTQDHVSTGVRFAEIARAWGMDTALTPVTA